MFNKNTKAVTPVLYDLDNQPILNTFTGEWYKAFDDMQKRAIQYALEHDIPCRGWAYVGIPAECMNYIITRFNEANSDCLSSEKELIDLHLWKICHTNIDRQHFDITIDAYFISGICWAETINDIQSIPVPILIRAYNALNDHGYDFSKEINEATVYDEAFFRKKMYGERNLGPVVEKLAHAAAKLALIPF